MPHARILPVYLTIACVELLACGADTPQTADDPVTGSTGSEASEDSAAAVAETSADAIHPAAEPNVTVWIAGDSTDRCALRWATV